MGRLGQGGHGLDFNPTLFSHPLADDGFTLSSADDAIRRFWIDHCIASRRIGEYFGRELEHAVCHQYLDPRRLQGHAGRPQGAARALQASLDEILAAPIDRQHNYDAVECKLFGLGSKAMSSARTRIYLGYAITRRTLLCLDSGHFHPTEVVSDKLSSVLLYVDRVLLHVSRGVRWDSDHVITLSDELQAVMQELVRGDYLGPRAYRPRLLRCKYQSRRCLGDRHAQCPAALCSRCWSHARCCSRPRQTATIPRG